MNTKSNSKTKVNVIDIANIAEDLLDDFPNSQPKGITQNLSKPIDLMNRLLQKEIDACAKNIGVDAEELQAWIDCQIEVPHKTLLCLLRTANEYRLDPLREEVLLTQYEDHWQASISVDGWIKLLHQHPAFSGITFTESPEPQNPQTPSNTWMECTIYRSDQVMPTSVREYLSEVQNEGEIWKKMPKRMLRHRVLQQCARLAMGLAIRERKEQEEFTHTQNITPLESQLNSPKPGPNKIGQMAKLKTILRN